ncbi:glycoside hydrolase family 9 protein [Cellulomonas sp. zg-ZUI22]|uniref:glycoside hydrolase family 9 protein n=1 Tax=Cellulomonas sp. zg-ZUI22 TaxID=2816955 RepID=UPI001A9489BF|nr:glycoside hydrolase family 9 protein [Cellulomonas sp. zg-ZUI22]MBO0898697.1 glycoside hydrolase family 9 protein [Cellulomonas sp. zg-ZUI22]
MPPITRERARRGGRLSGLAATAARTVAVVAALTVVGGTAPAAVAAPDPGTPVKVNQVAYVPGVAKVATLVSTSTAPVAWTLRDAAGRTVAEGTSTVKGADALSGDRTHLIDFSSYDTPGTGYVLSAGGSSSLPFDISADPLKKLRYDALAFFYHQRSGIAIEAQYVGSTYARAAGHLGVAPNQGDTSVPCRQSCGYSLDVRGGWYDAGDQGKYVVNGGIATWQLQNAYERTLHVDGADRAALGDGTLAIPERANGVPDVLDEARWEVDFLLRMQVPTGRTDAGMVHHKMHDENWTGIPTIPSQDAQRRILAPVSTAATLNMAAVAAQAARLWEPYDATFAAKALSAARTAYAAAKANPNRIASATDGTGGGAYGDTSVTDEFYWAAAELYATTGESSYRADVTGSSFYKGVSFAQRGYDWGWTGGLGDTTLALVPTGLPAADVAATRSAIVSFADAALSRLANQAYPAPNNAGSVYYWGSNGQVANNANALALAYDFTGQAKYRTAVYGALDYFQGRNPLNQSYVAGYGEKAVRNVHHRFWANQNDASLPIAPPGSFSGGPNSELQDPVAAAELAGCAAQKCFVDDIEAYSVNEVAINWNSALAWLTAWAAEQAGGQAPADTTAPSTPGTPVASAVADTSVTLTWAASTDAESGVAGYDVLDAAGAVLATSTTTSATVSGLTADTAYTFTVRARNGAGLASTSAPLTVRTTGGGTPVDAPPSTPGTPAAFNVTATGMTLVWAASTDDVRVAGYDVLQVEGAAQTVVATSTTPSVTIDGLAADGVYTFVVRARDSAGQLSGVSAPVTVDTSPRISPTPTPPPTTAACTVTYTASSWGSGFTAAVTVTNTGSTAWSSWQLGFTFPGDQKVTQGWSATWSQTGATVTATNAAWNGSLAAGGSTSIGFNGSYSGTNAAPTGFTVNGAACS